MKSYLNEGHKFQHLHLKKKIVTKVKNLFLGWPLFVENVRKSIFNIKSGTEVCQV